MTTPGPDLTFAPEAGAWAGLLGAGVERRRKGWLESRESLGLPADRPIVMAGHQAVIWHPGVLAKFIAIDRFATKFGGAPVWLIVDQDEHEFSPLRAPALDGAGSLVEERIALVEPAPPAGAAVADVPAFVPRRLELAGRPAAGCVGSGLKAIEAALRAHAGAGSAARQIGGALLDLARPLLTTEPRVIYTTDLTRTPVFRSLLDDLRADPARIVRLHNEAVRATPGSTVRELDISPDGSRVELPLWELGRSTRSRMMNTRLAEVPAEALAPTALLMTAAARLGLADLFIHGTGGGVYDRVTEAWVLAWLGVEPAPMAVASATLLLPLAGSAATERELAHAAWRAHHARHNPAALGDDEMSAWKREAVSAIAAARAAGGDPAPLFRAMHERLDAWRRDRAPALESLRHEVESVRRRVAARDLAGDRTWAFPLHESASLARLAAEIERRF